MITINQESNNLVIAMALGEFTLADFKELEKAADYALQSREKASLLLDLSDMLGFTVDVAWEEIRFARQHAKDFERIAVVTDDQWVQWSAWLARIFTDAEMQVFDDYISALAWVQKT
jgi:hypothetical protein